MPRLSCTRLAVAGQARGGIDPLWLLAGSAPAVDFNFSSDSMLDQVSGQDLITYTRPSTAWGWNGSQFVEFANDAPRIVVDPETGLRGLLVEESRTNIFTSSRDITNGFFSWNSSLATTTNSTSIFGSNGIGTIDAPAATTSTIYAAFACTPSTIYTLSFYVRLGTLPASDFRFALRDDTAGAFIAQAIVPNITPSAEEWRRVVYTFTTPVGCTLIRPYLYRFLAATGGTVSFDQAQLELGAFPTSPIITTSSALTRSADVGPYVNALAGQLRSAYVEHFPLAVGVRPLFSLDDNTANNRIELLTNGTDPGLVVTSGGSAVADIDAGSTTAGVRQRMAVRFAADDFAACVNGGSVLTDTAGALPTVDRMRIGSNQAGGYANGIITRVVGSAAPWSNATLQALTT